MAKAAPESYSRRESPPQSPSLAMPFFKMIFSWWNSATWGTWLLTKFSGEPVGTDQFGNRYFQNKDGSRRWVIYNGTVEASRVPPDWHGWLHHTYAEPPTKAPFKVRGFEKTHQPNLTGTDGAYRPSGSLAKGGARPPATGDYQAWKPD